MKGSVGNKKTNHTLGENVCKKKNHEELLSKIYNEHLKLKNKKAACFKNGPKISRDTSYRRQISI